MLLEYMFAMAQLKLYFSCAELTKDPREAIRFKALGLVIHDRVINKQPARR